jgi:hypothetical protein
MSSGGLGWGISMNTGGSSLVVKLYGINKPSFEQKKGCIMSKPSG